ASEAGAEEIDARGLAVAPGFIDIHSHGDGTLFDDPRAESALRQGVTTIIVGADGGSRAPARGEVEAGSTRFATFTDYFAAIDALRSSVNVASMVGLGAVRGAVVGMDDRPATQDELDRMTRIVEQALTDGACG